MPTPETLRQRIRAAGELEQLAAANVEASRRTERRMAELLRRMEVRSC
jgi:hypothetical protein